MFVSVPTAPVLVFLVHALVKSYTSFYLAGSSTQFSLSLSKLAQKTVIHMNFTTHCAIILATSYRGTVNATSPKPCSGRAFLQHCSHERTHVPWMFVGVSDFHVHHTFQTDPSRGILFEVVSSFLEKLFWLCLFFRGCAHAKM